MLRDVEIGEILEDLTSPFFVDRTGQRVAAQGLRDFEIEQVRRVEVLPIRAQDRLLSARVARDSGTPDARLPLRRLRRRCGGCRSRHEAARRSHAMRRIPMPNRAVKGRIAPQWRRLAAVAALVCCAASPDAHGAATYSLGARCIDLLSFVQIVDPYPGTAGNCSDSASDELHTSSSDARVELRVGTRRIGVVTQANASLHLFEPVPSRLLSEATISASLTDRFDMIALDSQGNFVAAGSMDIDIIASGLVSLQGSGSFATPSLPDVSESYLKYEITSGAGSVSDDVTITAPQTATRSVSTPISVRVNWLAGDAFTFAMSVLSQSYVVLGTDGSARASVEFGNSLDWLGIRNVTDANGVPVASFSAISPDTGVDWGDYVSVPEPPTAPGALVGAAVLGWLCRRKAGRAVAACPTSFGPRRRQTGRRIGRTSCS